MFLNFSFLIKYCKDKELSTALSSLRHACPSFYLKVTGKVEIVSKKISEQFFSESF